MSGPTRKIKSENGTKIVKVKVYAINIVPCNCWSHCFSPRKPTKHHLHQPWLTEHDVVLRIAVHIGLVQVGGEDFHVPTAAVDLLLMFHSELDYYWFTLITKRVKATGESVKPGVLTCLQTLKGKKKKKLALQVISL